MTKAFSYGIVIVVGFGRVPEWPKGTDCKSAGFAFGGSNPPSPTKKTDTAFAVSVFFLRTGSKQKHSVLRKQDFGGCELSVFAIGEMTAVHAVKENSTDFAAYAANVDESTLSHQKKT